MIPASRIPLVRGVFVIGGRGKEGAKVNVIARIHTGFSGKFGIPRQSGLVSSLPGEIVFEPAYRNPDALRGLEDFSHLWLIWEFSQARREDWSPTVRPPRLGGNRRVGVFATRSPFRPNPIGLSCVKLEEIVLGGERGPILRVSGADLLDGTPIYDIKPYLPYTDSHPEAKSGFSEKALQWKLDVDFPEDWLEKLPEGDRETVRALLEQDPRPSYQHDPERVYGMAYQGFNIRFTVDGNRLTVRGVERL